MSSKSKIPQYYISTQGKSNSKQNQIAIKDLIINWLFDMKYEERIKTISLVNYDICRSIIKMYEKYLTSSRLKFRINLNEKKPTISQHEGSEDTLNTSDNYRVNQKIFLNEVRFYKINKSNDAMTISRNLLTDKNSFIFFFDELSNTKFLSELSPVLFDQKQGVYTCSSPKWIDEKKYYTISQIIIGYFENILNIKYVLSKKKKNDVNDSSKAFFKKRNSILELIKNSSYKENLYDIIDLKKIISDVINDKTLINDEERRIASKKFLLGVYKPFKMFEPPVEYNVNSYYYKYKEMLMEKNEELLDNLIFYSFEGQSSIERCIKEKIIEAFHSYAEDKKIKNVILEITDPGFLLNNKKRKKKKKNKKNENAKNNEDVIDENENENKNEINNDNDIEENNKSFEINNIDNIDNKKEQKLEEDNKIIISNETNDNNTSTISNSSHNNKDNAQEKKNEIINELIEEKKEIKQNNSKDNIIPKEEEEEKEEEKNSVKQEDEKSEKEQEEKEEQKNEENININNSNNPNQNPKKKKKKKNKKKNFKLTEEELNQIYSSFYNENNNFSNQNQNKNFKNKINPIQITSSVTEKSVILHNLILSFEKNISKKISSLHEIKYNSILLLCQKIKNHFKSGISVTIYGSYSTGLELEESDIDISVEFIPNSNGKFYNNINLKTKSELINELSEYLSTFPEFKNLFPIPNTQIPILKMKIISENNIETKIDLTFNLNNTKNTINFYNSTLKKYRQIKPLTLLIKNLVKKNKLASVFDGGFSSHSIFIMVTANVRVLLKNKSSLNLGDLLNGFLHFYGKVFNYTNTAIDLMDKHNPYIITQEFANVPVFVDPITKTNVSKSSYLHQQLKKLFSDTYDKLVQGEDNLNKTFEDIFF